jgi:hypothetical protein
MFPYTQPMDLVRALALARKMMCGGLASHCSG